MIGRITMGAYFLGCISYNLEDKQELSESDKHTLQKQDGLRHKNRAEIIAYNQCTGDKKQLAEQFNDVVKLSKRVEKPVFHFSFSLSPGEKRTNAEIEQMAHACAKEFEFDKNQFIVVLHHDTNVQHFHIVANRVGFDGVVAKDNHSKRRVAALCRQLEERFKLNKVLSPRSFLPAEQKLLPRNDKRKARLISNIKNSLSQATSMQDFTHAMNNLGYQMIKGRGITFVDKQKVRVKGSDVGFSLAKIEKILAANNKLAILESKQEAYEAEIHQQSNRYTGNNISLQLLNKKWQDEHLANSPFLKDIEIVQDIIEALFRPVYVYDHVDPHFLPSYKKKKKKSKGIRR